MNRHIAELSFFILRTRTSTMTVTMKRYLRTFIYLQTVEIHTNYDNDNDTDIAVYWICYTVYLDAIARIFWMFLLEFNDV